MTIEDFGYNDFFKSGRKQAGLESLDVARVIAEHRESYRVIAASGEFTAQVTGKRMFTASSREDYPAVGDWVAITTLNTDQAVIHGIIPRQTVLKRKESGGAGVQIIAANVDTAFITQAVGQNFNLNRFERYAAMIAAGGVQPGIVLNKIDLLSPRELGAITSQIRARLPAFTITTVSTRTEEGLGGLAARLEKGKTYCFIGSSGVGKSSIINKLLEDEILATGHVSERTKKGRHVTTGRALFMLHKGAMVIDNPGMRELGVLDSRAGIDTVFDDLAEMAKSCRFSDCTHTNEPGCALGAAITLGVVNESQYRSYAKLKKENEFYDMTASERRTKNRAFGKFIKKAKEQVEKYT